jgi:hypothetical protein
MTSTSRYDEECARDGEGGAQVGFDFGGWLGSMQLSSTRNFPHSLRLLVTLTDSLFYGSRCTQVVGSEVEGSGRRSHKRVDTQADLELVSMVLPLSSYSPPWNYPASALIIVSFL